MRSFSQQPKRCRAYCSCGDPRCIISKRNSPEAQEKRLQERRNAVKDALALAKADRSRMWRSF